MNVKILFLLLTISITLLFLTTTNSLQITDQIKTIEYKQNTITLQLENTNQPIVIFTNKILNLKPQDKITIQGTKSIYKQQEQIIASKIVKD